MKPAILLLLVNLNIQCSVYSQSLAVNLKNNAQPVNYQVQSSDNVAGEKVLCFTTKAGLISMGAGLAAFIVGVKMSDDYTKNLPPHDPGGNDNGIPVYVAGVLAFGIGSCMALGGGIHDILKHAHKRVTVISPKANQIGLAYHFF